ncbi:MAG TPA: YbjN domain-containing protein, partial [Pseudomonadota bacterium]|nr:YbjN domain-containing protein [Pseudomonadota bacterium]
NYGMVIGNFEMDYSDGEVRFKTSIDVEDAELSESMVRSATYWAVVMMDRYLPGLLKVIGGSTPPAEAIDEIEAEDHPDPSKS